MSWTTTSDHPTYPFAIHSKPFGRLAPLDKLNDLHLHENCHTSQPWRCCSLLRCLCRQPSLPRKQRHRALSEVPLRATASGESHSVASSECRMGAASPLGSSSARMAPIPSPLESTVARAVTNSTRTTSNRFLSLNPTSMECLGFHRINSHASFNSFSLNAALTSYAQSSLLRGTEMQF